MTAPDAQHVPMLRPEALPALARRGVRVPAHARLEANRAAPVAPHRPEAGVVHLGLGAFHRAHQALVFDELLARGDPRWGVFAVAMRQPALAQALARQSQLYAVRIADEQGEQWRVGGAIMGTAVAATHPEQVVAALAAPSTRWITLTVTEKGYGPPLYGLLLYGLQARRDAGSPGLTIASCDNLQHNGRRLEAALLAQASSQDVTLSAWIQRHVVFPDSMVDRIVPAATPALLDQVQAALGVRDEAALATEAFWEWVIEDRFADPSDAAALADVGVTVVADVGPYETAKLRMLNASHSALACIGGLAALATVSDAVAHAPLRAFIHDLMTQEVAPTLQRHDLAGYRDALLRRFANPHLQHRLHQIASDSSQKIPQRWVPTIEAVLACGQMPQRLAFAAAAWMHYLLGQDAAGQRYQPNDPLAPRLQALARQHQGDAAASVQALGRDDAIWGARLPQHPAWLATVAAHWQRIDALGILAALAELNVSLASSTEP